MSLLKHLKNTLIVFGLLAGTSSVQAQENYLSINPPVATRSVDKVEVLEFFSYTCGHCAAIEPFIEDFTKTLPEKAVFTPVPVGFNASTQALQHLFYTLVALDRQDLHPKVFDAIQKENKNLFTRDNIIAWAVSQGIDKTRFEASYDSFGVKTKVNQAKELSKQYNIQSTPSFAIAGKYVTSPGMTGSYESSINVVKELLAKELP